MLNGINLLHIGSIVSGGKIDQSKERCLEVYQRKVTLRKIRKKNKITHKIYFHTNRSTLEKKSIQQKIDNLQIIKYLPNIIKRDNQENSRYLFKIFFTYP